MKVLTITLLICGGWLLWSARSIDVDAHHYGSILYMMDRDGDDAATVSWDRRKAIEEGKHAYSLLYRASKTLALAGAIVAAATIVQLVIGRRKTPNQQLRRNALDLT